MPSFSSDFVAARLNELTILSIASLSLGISFLLLSLSSSFPVLGGVWVPYLTVLVGVPSCAVCPIVRSQFSRVAGKGRQGEILSIVAAVENLLVL